MKTISFTLSLLASLQLNSQTILDANGAGNTYEDITAVLAPGYDPVEEPDCSHTLFGRHIDEIYDADLDTNVFRFFMHVSEDDDRCINFDRQRNEIKTYDKSPDNLLGIEGETVVYKWKFKIDANFQVSSSFTHLHQLKSVGGSLSSMPMYTLTARKATPDRLELRYAETTSQVTLSQTPLAPFKGEWLEVTETITYGTSGAYEIEIKKVSDNSVLFSYSDNDIINWRSGADFVRPKWGIYRSLNSPLDLRDEEVLFANFSIEEQIPLSNKSLEKDNNTIKIIPNPSTHKVSFIESKLNSYDQLEIYDLQGKLLLTELRTETNQINVSNFKSGLYLVAFFKNNSKISISKMIIN